MLNDNTLNNKPHPRPSLFSNSALPRLSLNLHTMPPAPANSLRKLILLGILILSLLTLIAFLIFGQ